MFSFNKDSLLLELQAVARSARALNQPFPENLEESASRNLLPCFSTRYTVPKSSTVVPYTNQVSPGRRIKCQDPAEWQPRYRLLIHSVTGSRITSLPDTNALQYRLSIHGMAGDYRRVIHGPSP